MDDKNELLDEYDAEQKVEKNSFSFFNAGVYGHVCRFFTDSS